MKYIFALLLSLSTTLCYPQAMNLGEPAQTNFYQEVPYRNVKGKLLIQVEIDGKMHTFLLDTGAPCQLTKDLATLLNVKLGAQVGINDAVGNAGKAATGVLPSVKIGNIEFKNTPVVIFNSPILSQCFGAEGNIGSNLLRNTIIQFNSKKGTVILTDDMSKLAIKPINGIDLKPDPANQSSPYFEVFVKPGVKGLFLFDSGDSDFLAMDNHYMDFFKKYNVYQKLAAGYGGNSFNTNGIENNNIKYRLKFNNITLGNAAFSNAITETTFNQLGTGDRIGAKLLDYSIVTIDYLHKKIYIDPFATQTDLAEKRWPMAPTYADGKLVVGLVWDKLKDKIKPGMQIIAVNDINTEHIELCPLLTQPSILTDMERATLTLKDDKGNVTKVDMVKE